MFKQSVLAVAIIIASTSANATTNLVQNGSFESMTQVPGKFFVDSYGFTLFPSSGQINDWTISGASVDNVWNTYWTPAAGYYSLDLNGSNSQATISQTLSTTVGQQYQLTFSLAGNVDGGSHIKMVQVSAGNAMQDFTFDTAGKSRTNMGWKTETLNFNATSSSTILSFKSLSTDNLYYGPVLDNVSVAAVASFAAAASAAPVPEPETYAMMLAGLGLVGFMARRKKSA